MNAKIKDKIMVQRQLQKDCEIYSLEKPIQKMLWYPIVPAAPLALFRKDIA